MAIIFGISGCGKKEYIVFPFSASDVVKIETYGARFQVKERANGENRFTKNL